MNQMIGDTVRIMMMKISKFFLSIPNLADENDPYIYVLVVQSEKPFDTDFIKKDIEINAPICGPLVEQRLEIYLKARFPEINFTLEIYP